MADVDALANAVKALFPPVVNPYFGTDPLTKGVTLPWTFVLISLPSISERSLARTPHAHRVIVRARIAAASDTAARRVARNLMPALEGSRPGADGWRCTALEQLMDDPQVYQDRDIKLDNNQHPTVCAIDYAFMAAPIR